MCHVNMLKEYFDRDSSISKPITVVNTVPQESNVFEPEVNSDFICKSDPGPSKLENSDILRNLNNKLSHLEPSQQEELKQLKAKEVSAFATPNGLYQYKVMPFGMKNSPATFQRLVNNVICGLYCCDAHVDDAIIY